MNENKKSKYCSLTHYNTNSLFRQKRATIMSYLKLTKSYSCWCLLAGIINTIWQFMQIGVFWKQNWCICTCFGCIWIIHWNVYYFNLHSILDVIARYYMHIQYLNCDTFKCVFVCWICIKNQCQIMWNVQIIKNK